MFLYFLDLFGTSIFAVSGVILAFRLRMDAVGVLVLAAAVAIGGGTLRDVILDVPVFWLRDNTYIWVIIFTCIITGCLINRYRITWWFLPISDALGLGVFAIIGAEKALRLGLSPTVAVIMGTLTGCGGGAIRDVLARRIPFVLKEEIYASACILGAGVYAILYQKQVDADIAISIGIAVALAIRIPAIIWNISLPRFSYRPQK